MRFYYKIWHFISQFMGRNTKFTPTAVIKDQLNEKRALPLGVKEFHEWSDRIISGACIPGATTESIKFALADQLLHLGPTVDFEADLYFIKCLRKFAINQVADAMRNEIRDTAKARLAAQQEKTKLEVVENKSGEVTPQTTGITNGQEVLRNS
jgi:hypothetical protein